MAQLDTDLWDSGDDPARAQTKRLKALLHFLLPRVITEDYDDVTWCCAAESNCPSQAPALSPGHAPIAVMIDWPAKLLGLRLRLPRHLSSSETHSGRCHCPASLQRLSSTGKHTQSSAVPSSVSVKLTAYLNLLSYIFSLSHKAEVVAPSFSWYQGQTLLP